jgi:cytochrome c-type biogenesis protein CcmH
MTVFWTLFFLILVLAAVFALWPMLGKSSNTKITALTAVLLFPLVGYFLYQSVGTPEAIGIEVTAPVDRAETGQTAAPASAPGKDMASLADGLRQRLNESPEDVEGWVLLARSYKNLERYPEAVEALETAQDLMPDDPLIRVELVEARLFNSNKPQLTSAMVAELERAVRDDPTLQKGLWLLGIAAAQAGDDEAAINWWTRLQQQIEPDSQIAITIGQQLDEARGRLGMESEQANSVATESDWQGVSVTLQLSDQATADWPDLPAGHVPAGMVLFVIARTEGSSKGPPLGARKINQPVFPLQLTISDDDSMMPQRPISSAPVLQLQARLSQSGQPTASAGDWQSETMTSKSEDGDSIVLELVQKLQ